MHVFKIQIQTDDVKGLLERASKGVSSVNGRLNGTTTEGRFQAQGVTGQYKIEGDTLFIGIEDKPWLASYSLVEEKIREFFQ